MLQRAFIVGITCQILMSSSVTFAQTDSRDSTCREHPVALHIPERSARAEDGSEFARRIAGLSLEEREDAMVREILAGNVPSFSRTFKAIRIEEKIHSLSHELVVFVSCDYLAIGSDQDHLYIPMTPGNAQYLADTLECSLPTKKLVDIIYKQADTKLHPQPIPPSDTMTTVPVFLQHTDSIQQQILETGIKRAALYLMAGHKKDIIISNQIYDPERTSDRVVIYGWHLDDSQPIQAVYNGHVDWYADYSHGVRLIYRKACLNGKAVDLQQLLKDARLCRLLSSEGIIPAPFYPCP